MEDPRFYRRKLPHIQPAGGDFAITYRLYGSLPQAKIGKWKRERDESLDKLEQQWGKKYAADKGVVGFDKVYLREIEDIHDRYFYTINEELDQSGFGPDYLRKGEIAKVVSDSLFYLEAEGGFDLVAFCIMPNHVHLILKDVEPILFRLLQRHKRFTARQANVILNRTGHSFWQAENYDHLIRNETDFYHQVRYALNNPVQAGLIQHWEDWPFSYLAEGVI